MSGAHKERDTPADISFDCQPFDIAFHPSADVLAVGLVSGAVHLIALSASVAPGARAGAGTGDTGGRSGGARRLRVNPHSGAVRSLAFNAAGDGACCHLFEDNADARNDTLSYNTSSLSCFYFCSSVHSFK